MLNTRVPKVGAPPVEMHPFSEDELKSTWTAMGLRNKRAGRVGGSRSRTACSTSCGPWRGRDGDDLLFVTETGHQLHASAVKRTVDWVSLARGRRIHDLRHTAACLWLARGVDPVTVQAWMGHASIATTNIYLHHLGTAAGQAGLDRLNGRGNTGGTRREERDA